MTDETGRPYPALEKCIVIDARLRSRKSVVADLKRSKLFDEVQEAKSLAEALNVLSTATIDACVVGSSLSAKGASKLIEEGKKSDPTNSCAFIRLVPQSKAEIAKNTSDADAVITVPCTKTNFVEGLVKGVVSANQDSPWTGIPLEEFTEGLDDETFSPTAEVSSPTPSSPAPSALSASPFSPEKVSEGTAKLRLLAKPYIDGSKKLGADGRGDEEVALEIRLIARHIAKHDDKEGEPNVFAIFLEACLHEWFADFVNHGDSQAMDTFRKRILHFVIDSAG